MIYSNTYVDLGKTKPREAPPPQTSPDSTPPTRVQPRPTIPTYFWAILTSVFKFLFSDIKSTLTNLLILFFGWQYFGGSLSLPWPLRSSPVGVKLGRDFRAPLSNALADGWDTLASDLESGKSIADADNHLKQAFHDSRNKEFSEKCSSQFSAILPEGKDFSDEVSKAKYIKLSRDFAHGLRGGH